MRARERGFRTVKFFPAGTSGGPAAIAALAAPLHDLRFVPTGGVSQANLGEYLGLGVNGDVASWGGLLNDAQTYYDVAWWLMLFPGMFLVLTTLAFNLLGDGLRDALDVRADR